LARISGFSRSQGSAVPVLCHDTSVSGSCRQNLRRTRVGWLCPASPRCGAAYLDSADCAAVTMSWSLAVLPLRSVPVQTPVAPPVWLYPHSGTARDHACPPLSTMMHQAL